MNGPIILGLIFLVVLLLRKHSAIVVETFSTAVQIAGNSIAPALKLFAVVVVVVVVASATYLNRHALTLIEIKDLSFWDMLLLMIGWGRWLWGHVISGVILFGVPALLIWALSKWRSGFVWLWSLWWFTLITLLFLGMVGGLFGWIRPLGLAQPVPPISVAGTSNKTSAGLEGKEIIQCPNNNIEEVSQQCHIPAGASRLIKPSRRGRVKNIHVCFRPSWASWNEYKIKGRWQGWLVSAPADKDLELTYIMSTKACLPD